MSSESFSLLKSGSVFCINLNFRIIAKHDFSRPFRFSRSSSNRAFFRISRFQITPPSLTLLCPCHQIFNTMIMSSILLFLRFFFQIVNVYGFSLFLLNRFRHAPLLFLTYHLWLIYDTFCLFTLIEAP